MNDLRAKLLAAGTVLLAVTLPLAAQSTDAAGGGDDILQGTSHPPIRIIIPPSGAALAGPTGYTPTQLRHAYGFDAISNQGAGQTIAIVDAYDDSAAESDLGVFNTKFGLPACTTANGCFKKVYASGTKPRANAGWAGEISLDVQWAHAIAPRAKILLVEAASASNAALYRAVDVAVQNGATVVSMSWGGPEASNETSTDSHFNRPGVTMVVSSGDSGNGAEYPAASPYVVSVGGTHLTLSGGTYVTETAWSGSGGGISAYETEPSYQVRAGIGSGGKRGIPDVAYDADPNTGVPVYCSVCRPAGWLQVGGTSMSAPQWAALFGIANSIRAGNGKSALSGVNSALYTAPGSYYHDITSGKNGSCGAVCTAGPGYDFVTGLGSPQANLIITQLASLP